MDLVQASLLTIGPSVGGSRALDQTYEPTEGALTQAGSAGASPSQFLLDPRSSLLVDTPRPSPTRLQPALPAAVCPALGVPPYLAAAARQDAALLVWLTTQAGGGPQRDGSSREESPVDGAGDGSVDSLDVAVDDVFAELAVWD